MSLDTGTEINVDKVVTPTNHNKKGSCWEQHFDVNHIHLYFHLVSNDPIKIYKHTGKTIQRNALYPHQLWPRSFRTECVTKLIIIISGRRALVAVICERCISTRHDIQQVLID